jgi:hypothetical protein
MDYAMWRACERFHIDPDKWDVMDVWKQASLIAYSQIRCYEESKLEALLMAIVKAKGML